MTKKIRSGVEIFNRDEQPIGKSWEEWTTEWWRWFLSTPKSRHPSFDRSPEGTAGCYRDTDVIFLAATPRTHARRIFIPPNKAVLFPIINFTISYSENPALKTDAEMIENAKLNIDDIVKKKANIDGIDFAISENNRVRTPPFDFTFPRDNIYGVREGPTRGVGDGFWIFVKPLRRGSHKIRTYGSCLSGRVEIEANVDLVVENEGFTSNQ